MLNPKNLKTANDVRNFLKKENLQCTQKYSGMEETEKGTVVTYQFLFPNKKHAEIFMKMAELAEGAEKFLQS